MLPLPDEGDEVEIVVEYDLPDYIKKQADDPQWHLAGKVHDWRNHVPEHIQVLWPTFTQTQRHALTAWAEELASREHWD